MLPEFWMSLGKVRENNWFWLGLLELPFKSIVSPGWNDSPNLLIKKVPTLETKVALYLAVAKAKFSGTVMFKIRLWINLWLIELFCTSISVVEASKSKGIGNELKGTWSVKEIS